MSTYSKLFEFFIFIDGDLKFISKRLDAHYDWLPSPYTLKERHPKTKIVDYGDGCEVKHDVEAESFIILVSRAKCSFFEKVKSLNVKYSLLVKNIYIIWYKMDISVCSMLQMLRCQRGRGASTHSLPLTSKVKTALS